MIIVVEGVDGSGKTTLASRLAKELKAIYLKSEVRPQTLEAATFFHCMALTTSLRYPVVCDRYPTISELIYGSLRGKPQFSREWALKTYSDLNVIYCCPKRSTIKENVSSHRDTSDVVENLDLLIDSYLSFMDEHRYCFRRFICYDYEREETVNLRFFNE